MNISKIFSVAHSSHNESVVESGKEKEKLNKKEENSSPSFLEIIINNFRDNMLDM